VAFGLARLEKTLFFPFKKKYFQHVQYLDTVMIDFDTTPKLNTKLIG
jgi:hypothetical protein